MAYNIWSSYNNWGDSAPETSSLTASVLGIPDGVHSLVYYQVPDVGLVDLTLPIGVVDATANAGVLTATLEVSVGTKVIGLVPGGNPPATGTATYGVTE